MSSINAKVKLRIDTEANWTSSNPTLLAGEVAISSDQLHAGTDQPKFKIGNGSDAWSSLDYYPVSGGGSYLEISNNLSDVASATTAFSNIKQAASETSTGVAEIATQAETNTGTDDVRFVTPLKFQTRLAAYAQPLDLDLTAIAGLSPSNDDIIQRKSGAWTNRTIAQYYADLQASVKDDVYFTIYFEHGNIAAPADATTYYWGALTNATPSTSAQDRNVAWAFGDCTLIAATIGSRAGTGGTAGVNNSLYFRLNDTTDTTLSTTISYSVTGTVQTYTATGLSTNITNGDFFEMKLVTGTWASNPSNIGTSGYLLFKRR